MACSADASTTCHAAQELSDCLHHGAELSCRLLLTVTRLGLVRCCSRLATNRELVRAAETEEQGLLGAAAQSNVPEMLISVCPPSPGILFPCTFCMHNQCRGWAGYLR